MEGLEAHRDFYDAMIAYLPANESTDVTREPVKEDKIEAPTPAPTASPTRQRPKPAAGRDNQAKPHIKRSGGKVRPGFEGAKIVRKKRDE